MSRITACIGVAAVVAVAALGMQLRLRDPLSSPVINAEDPYTHIALARQFLAGSFAPSTPDGTLYPPAFDLTLAGVALATGLSFATLAVVLPAVFGALGILAIAALCWRPFGVAGAVVAATAYAVMPELVFRGSMLSPTALDQAVLPVLLLALVQVALARWRWLALAIPLVAFEVFSHPWTLGVLATGAAAALGLQAARGWHAGERRWTAGGVLAVTALVGGGLGFALQGCAGWCGPGFDRVVDAPLPMAVLAGLLLWGSLTPLAWWIGRRWWRRSAGHRTAQPAALWRSVALSAGHLVALVLVLGAATAAGLPAHVGPGSFGWPVLLLAGAGLVCSPWAKAPWGQLAAGWCWGTLPLVVFNPFHSPYWPHRSMAYLAVGLAMLAGLAVHAGQKAVVRVPWHRVLASPAWRGRVPALATVALLGVAGVGVVEATPPPFAWYRMFDVCEDAALKQVAQEAAADPDGSYVMGSWQAKLVVAAFASDARRVWYASAFFVAPGTRQPVVDDALRQGHQVHVVVDRYTVRAGLDTGFLAESSWSLVSAGCDGPSAVLEYQVADTTRFVPKAGNPWWVEVDILVPQRVAHAQWSVDGGGWNELQRTDWGTWAVGTHVAPGSTVSFRAQLQDGTAAESPATVWVPVA